MTTAQYANSSEVQRTLANIFKPWCLDNGFKKLSAKRCSFIKHSASRPDVILAFEVQCNSFSRATHGGLFTLNANAGVIKPTYLTSPHARVLDYCSQEMAEKAIQLEEQIVRDRPQLDKPGRPWSPGFDNWCRYYSIQDVQAWGHFLGPYLPFLLKQLITKLALSEDAFFL
jgi:hypothetical protein